MNQSQGSQMGGEGRSVENVKNAFPFGLWWLRALFCPVGAPPPPVPGRGAFVSYAMFRRCSVDVPSMFRRCSVDAPVPAAFPAAPAAPWGAPGPRAHSRPRPPALPSAMGAAMAVGSRISHRDGSDLTRRRHFVQNRLNSLRSIKTMAPTPNATTTATAPPAKR